MGLLKRLFSDSDTESVQQSAVYSSEEIGTLLDRRELVVTPILDRQSQLEKSQASIDLRLDNVFVEFTTGRGFGVDPIHPTSDYASRMTVDYTDKYYLQPGRLVLAQCFEWVRIPSTAAGYLDGRSSMGRYGLAVHATAGWVDPGFTGHIVFELVNTGEMPVLLRPLQRVARLTLFRCSAKEYDGQYSFQTYPKVPPEPDEDLIAIRARLGVDAD